MSSDNYCPSPPRTRHTPCFRARTIRQKNSNLNFDVSPFPQSDTGKTSITFGKIYGLAILKQSKHIVDAYNLVKLFTSNEAQKNLAENGGLPPVRLDLLASVPHDAVGPVFYTSALRSRGFLDPNTAETENIFRTMIEDVSVGRQNTHDAIRRAGQEMSTLFH